MSQKLPALVILLALILAALSPLTAGAQAPPDIVAAVSPTSAAQDDTNLVLTITLAGQSPPTPPLEAPLLGVSIGSLDATSYSRDSLAVVTAQFDVPAGATLGPQEISLTFRGPGGEPLTFAEPGAFEIRPAAPGSSPTTTAVETPRESYAVVDTGQVACYDDGAAIACPAEGQAFYGQDAQHDGYLPAYTVGTDGLTVYDHVTGLTWTQSPDTNHDGEIDAADKLTAAEVGTYVDALNAQAYGGYDDWRLPSIKELYSLIDFRGTDPVPEATGTSGLVPFIDTDYFAFAYGDPAAGERIIDAQFLSSTGYVGRVFNGQTAIFGVNFADGRIKAYPSDKAQFVYLVRGNPDYGLNDLVDNGDGTVTDRATGLIWSQADDGGPGMSWEDALAWVEQMNDQHYLGYDDWRLPNAKELQSIVDYSRAPDTTGSAAIDPIFHLTEITDEAGEADYGFYWTGTTHARFDGSGTAAVYISFGRGLGSMDGTTVIDVHGAGCQRADPKEGDPADYPAWGFGPQGDVRRVFNHVLLVRDVDEEETGPSYPHYLPLILK